MSDPDPDGTNRSDARTSANRDDDGTAGGKDVYEVDLADSDPTSEGRGDLRGSATGEDGRATDGESVGVPVPQEYVGAFVAEAFEDPERSTTFEEVVSAVVDEAAREEWDALATETQVVELLGIAAEYDRRAVEHLDRIQSDGSTVEESVGETFAEARRCRRNADLVRDGIADGYRSGRIDDGDLVGGVEAFGFETETIAIREELVESVAEKYGFDCRPYGGTLFDEGEHTARGHDVW